MNDQMSDTTTMWSPAVSALAARAVELAASGASETKAAAELKAMAPDSGSLRDAYDVVIAGLARNPVPDVTGILAARALRAA